MISTIAHAADSPFTTHPENTWLKQSPREGAPAPGFYYEGSGAFDPFSNQWIHHAGHDGWLRRGENERLRQRLMIGHGWNLQKFNGRLLNFGTLPRGLIEKYRLD